MIKGTVAAAAALMLCGCIIDRVSTGPMTHDSRSVELGKFEMARVQLNMGVGELSVEGGSPKLLEAGFDYNVPAWKPVVESNSSGFRADVTIRQPSRGASGGNSRYKWDLRVNNDIPLDLVTHLGTGAARMNLGSVRLRSLQVHMGVGSLNLDLRGAPKDNYDVEVHGGVGEATILVPNSVGISASAKGGIGDISVQGLQKRNGRWVNEAYDRAPVRIRLEISGGVGDIRLVAE